MMLGKLLQLRLIIRRLQLSVKRKLREHVLMKKGINGLQSLIQIKGADERFEYICQQGRAGSSSGQLLSFTEQYVFAKLQALGKFHE
ncbi:hypothetical protein D3C77_629990 [compost metagenome]